MFCQNCGKNVDEGVSFCPQCGANLNGAAPAPQAQQADQNIPATIIFKPGKLFIQLLITKGVIEIDGVKYQASMGGSTEIKLPAKPVSIFCYGLELGFIKNNRASTSLSLKPGDRYEITYKTRFYYWLSGKLNVTKL